jgi:hypothetical protein
MYLVLFICFWKRVCCDCYIAAVFTEFWLVRYLHQVLWRKGIAYRNCIYGVLLILVVLNRGLVLDCYVAAMFTEFCLSCWCLHQVWRQMLLEQLMLISPVGGVPSTRYFTRRWGGWGALVIRDFTSTGKTLPPIHVLKMLKQSYSNKWQLVTEASANPGSGLVVIPPSWSTWLLSHPEGPSRASIPASSNGALISGAIPGCRKSGGMNVGCRYNWHFTQSQELQRVSFPSERKWNQTSVDDSTCARPSCSIFS